jgi:hypothetical protein
MGKYLFDLTLLHSIATLGVPGRTAARKIAAGSLTVEGAKSSLASGAL